MTNPNGAADPAVSARQRPDAPLGTLIFRAGLVPADQLEDALEEGIKRGRRLGEILIERGLIQESDLARILAGQKGLRYIDPSELELDAEAIALLAEEKARLYRALPVGFEGGAPLVAITDPTNEVVLREVTAALGVEPRFAVAPKTSLVEAIGAAYGRPTANGTLPAAEGLRLAEPAAEEPEEDAIFAPHLTPPDPAAAHSNEAIVEENPIDIGAAAEPPPTLPEPSPLAETEPPAPTLVAAPDPAPLTEADAFHAAPEPTADPEPAVAPAPQLVPEPDLAAEPMADPGPEAGAETEPAPEPEAGAEREPSPETEAAAETEPAPEPEAAAEADPAPDPEPGLGDWSDRAPTAESAEIESHQVVLRLANGERVHFGSALAEPLAAEQAKTFIRDLAGLQPGDWPYVGGRFLKPDTIVSVDIVEQTDRG
jgi:hypothetical protein